MFNRPRVLKASTLALLTIFTFGCATQLVTIYTPFNKAEAEKIFEKGPNTIKGSALLRQNNGGVVTCAGRQVNLILATPYSNERIFILYKNNERGFLRQMFANQRPPFANDNPDYYEATRKTVCDAQGYFKFDNVADGDYYLTTSIQWSANQYTLEGGNLMQRLRVSNGETRDVVLAW